MATTDYTDLETVRTRLGATTTKDDATLKSNITTVSRLIDQYCKRFFFNATQTRYYTRRDRDSETLLWTDDLAAAPTTIATDDDGDGTFENTWATTDFYVAPYNAALESPAKPYDRIEVTPEGLYLFPTTRRGIKIVGSFGWPAVPDTVKEAAVLQVMRAFNRKNAIFGVTGGADMGQAFVIAKLDPDVQLYLQDFCREETG